MSPHKYYNAIQYLKKEHGKFPLLLKEITSVPKGLYIRGNQEILLSKPAIAIVGTRKATSNGLCLAEKFAKGLAEQGVIIVSGLALGIDQAAHWGALKGGGGTIAVLANGLNDIYPYQNRKLAEEIIKCNGALISEYPPTMPSLPQHFLERNRIISGLSLGVLVIEAPFKSGALVTARHAVEQNRDVFVIPGSISNKNYIGSHKLIQSGAKLVTCADDILEELNLPINNKKGAGHHPQLTLEQQMVLNYIEVAGHSLPIDKIIELTKLDPRIINEAITFLLVSDIIKESNGQYYL